MCVCVCECGHMWARVCPARGNGHHTEKGQTQPVLTRPNSANIESGETLPQFTELIASVEGDVGGVGW